MSGVVPGERRRDNEHRNLPMAEKTLHTTKNFRECVKTLGKVGFYLKRQRLMCRLI